MHIAAEVSCWKEEVVVGLYSSSNSRADASQSVLGLFRGVETRQGRKRFGFFPLKFQF